VIGRRQRAANGKGLFGRGRTAREGRRGRKGQPERTPGQLARAELGEGLGHLWHAATHSAEGLGGTVGPRLRGVRTLALVPLAAAARASVAQAGRLGKKASAKAPMTKESKMARKRTKWLAGLVAAGAAVGVAGGLMARRRNRSQWDEYESQGRATARTDTAVSPVAGMGKQTAHDWATSSAKDTAGATTTTEKVGDPLDLTAEQFADNTSSVSKNSKG
jgi:hypothetical protein